MNQEQKDFVLQRLIPHIMRENGNGFNMSVWEIAWRYFDRETDYVGKMIHQRPACGTVACIGGSIEMLMRKDFNHPQRSFSEHQIAEHIGLSERQSQVLFYGWKESYSNENLLWPKDYRDRYAIANSPLKQAEVACDLLREVVATEGKVLDEPASV